MLFSDICSFLLFFLFRWLFNLTTCTVYAFCGVLFGLCSLSNLTVLSCVCWLKVCCPNYGNQSIFYTVYYYSMQKPTIITETQYKVWSSVCFKDGNDRIEHIQLTDIRSFYYNFGQKICHVKLLLLLCTLSETSLILIIWWMLLQEDKVFCFQSEVPRSPGTAQLICFLGFSVFNLPLDNTLQSLFGV